MQNKDKQNLKMRWLLVFFICVSLGISAFCLSFISTHKYEDFVFSIIALVITILFAVFELFMTLYNYKKPLSLFRFAFTDNGFINPIGVLTMIMISLIGLGLFLTGVIMFSIKDDISIRCNSLVILSLGSYVLINCIYYVFFILLNKKKTL